MFFGRVLIVLEWALDDSGVRGQVCSQTGTICLLHLPDEMLNQMDG